MQINCRKIDVEVMVASVDGRAPNSLALIKAHPPTNAGTVRTPVKNNNHLNAKYHGSASSSNQRLIAKKQKRCYFSVKQLLVNKN